MQLGLRSSMRRACRSLSTAALRPFRVERYPGWTDGSDSLSSSETEPLTLEALLALADADSAARWAALSLGYPSHNEGSPWLREAICDTIYPHALAPHQLNVCAPQEAIFLSVSALLSPGEHVVATVPHYQSLSEVARAVGCRVSAWRPSAPVSASSPARFDPAALRDLLSSASASGARTRLVIANWPHNPTGALPTDAEFEEVLEACDAAGAHLLVDEMYRGLEHEGVAPLPAACEVYSRGLSVGGLSKTVGLPGLRLGWVGSQDGDLLRRIAQLKDYTTICPAAPSEALGLIAVRAHGALLARSRTMVARGLTAARELARAHVQVL